MAADWPVVLLGDVADVLTGYPFTSSRYVDSADAPRLLRGDNVVQGALRWDGAKRWPAEAVGAVADYALQDGDVVVAMDRPWIEAGLKYASIRSDDLPALLVQRVARLRGTARLHTPFLRYAIGSRAFTNHVLSVQTGTTVPHISATQIKQFSFPLPPLCEQRTIAGILGALDARIELNRRMSETLERMARALSESWFAKLQPADAVIADYSSLNPESWEPRSRPVAIDYVDLAGVKWGRMQAPTRHAGDAPSRAQRVLRPGDTIVGTVRPGNGSYALVSEEGLTGSTGFAVLRPHRHENRAFVYLAATAPGNIEALAHLADGAAYPAIRPEVVAMTPVSRVPEPVLADFATVTNPLLDRFAHAESESRTLAALRDALLPRLISGELRVPDAERITVEAGA